MRRLVPIDRYWQTAKHLRAEQIIARARSRLLPTRPKLGPVMAQRPGPNDLAWITRPQSMLGPSSFTFLSETRVIEEASGWRKSETPLLWLYNLHYFDVLLSNTATTHPQWVTALISRWIEQNPPGFAPGWDPYPTSLRIVNWIKYALAGGELDAPAIASLSAQADWLGARVEWHLLGNHLFANAKALWFAGHFFSDPRATAMLDSALAILSRELDEQVLPDGFHFERSPMYHAIILEDVLDMVAIARRYQTGPAVAAMVDRLTVAARRMLPALTAMTHPDGDHGFFNDTAIGVSATATELCTFAHDVLDSGACTATKEPAPEFTHLAHAGYLTGRRGKACLLFDVGAVGPDYLPGHAHADSLSLELSLATERVVVNGGTSCYGVSAERLRQRGTAAHSTVIVDGQDSSEVWGGFRVARRARPFDLTIENTKAAFLAACSHDGYRRLPGRADHRRSIEFSTGKLIVEDLIKSARNHDARAHYILHPDVMVITVAERSVSLRLRSGQVVGVTVEHGIVAIADTIWAPRFGVRIPTKCLAIDLVGGRSKVQFRWDDAIDA